MYHVIIFFSLIVTISSALDPNEQIAICKLNGTDTILNCADPCNSTNNRIICQNENIVDIVFFGNNLNTPIPTEYGSFSNLTRLDLNSNSLIGAIPDQLGNLTNLKYLFLQYNGLTGTIPSKLGNLKSLSQLTLNNNNLTGSIAKELGSLVDLNVLYLSHNSLSGLIPKRIDIFTKLNYLYLDNNQFSGTIPEDLGNITSLQTLHLGNNNLTGTIPTQLGKLLNLNVLDLSNNQLTGTIPTQVLNLVDNGLQLNTSNNPLDLSQPIYPQPDDSNNQPNMNSPQPNNPNPQPNNSIYSLQVNQTLNLSDGNFVFQIVNISSGSLLTNNTNLTTTIMNLSENSILSITNSTIHVQENITIPTGFILSITNPTTTSLETSGCMNIQPNTTINISLPSNYGDTQSNDLRLISFKCKTGTFSKVNINNECTELVENKISFVLTQSSNRKCTSSSTQETITICAIVTIFFISLLF